MSRHLKLCKSVYIYLSEKEYNDVLLSLSKTIYKSVSEYGRKRITGKPVTVIYRDRAFDDFIELCISIKKDLDAILSHNEFTDEEKEWCRKEIMTIKETMIQIYNHVRQNKNNRKHFRGPEI